MTGSVSWEQLVGFVAIIAAIFGLWWRIEGRIERMISPINQTLSVVQAEIRLTDKELSKFKIHVAENYAKHDDVTGMKDEIVGRLNDLSGRIDKAIDRRGA